jgi:hypothetical protein
VIAVRMARGALVDYRTGARLRVATEAETMASLYLAEQSESHAGVIEVDGRPCYVAGGSVEAIVAECACGQAFTSGEWSALPRVGEMEDGEGGVLELRNCPCGSTRARGMP